MLYLRKLNYQSITPGKDLTAVEINRDMFVRLLSDTVIFHINAQNTFEKTGYYMSMNVEDARRLRDQLTEAIGE